MTTRTRSLIGLALSLALGGAMAGVDNVPGAMTDAWRDRCKKTCRAPAKRNRSEGVRKQRDKAKASRKSRVKNKGR